MIKRILIGLVLISGLGFMQAKTEEAPAASKKTTTVESLILAGKAKEAANLAKKTKGSFDEAITKLLSDVDNQITGRKIEEAQKTITAADIFLNAYAAVDKAKVLPRDAVQGRMLRIEGIQLNDKKEYEKGEAVLRQALEISQKAKDPLLEAGVHNNLGYALRYQDKTAEAFKEFSTAAQMAESQKDNLRAGSYNINLGEIQLRRDSAADAIESFKRAVEQNRAAGQPEREARALYMQATALSQMDLMGGSSVILKQALPLYKQAVDIYEKLGNERNASLTWFTMAEKLAITKQWDQAAAYAEKALPYYVKARDRSGQHSCYTLLANAYKQLRNNAKAVQNLKLANDTKE